MKKTQISVQFFWIIISICILPTFLNLLGINFACSPETIDINTVKNLNASKTEVIDVMYYTLSGSFIHTILEWSTFCTAIFTVILSLIHFYLKKDVVTPIIGLALFTSGCMDAFHTLAADRLIQGVVDMQNFIPFSWAISRLCNALIIISIATFFILVRPKKWEKRIGMVVLAVFGMIAFIVIFICAHTNLPTTQFPNSIITRPWDIAPLILYLFAGFTVLPRFYKQYPSLFSYALLVSMVPQVASLLHMVFGSTELFDNHFNIAHFLKLFSYVVLLCGLILDYISTYQSQVNTTKQLTQALDVFESIVPEEILPFNKHIL